MVSEVSLEVYLVIPNAEDCSHGLVGLEVLAVLRILKLVLLNVRPQAPSGLRPGQLLSFGGAHDSGQLGGQGHRLGQPSALLLLVKSGRSDITFLEHVDFLDGIQEP